jgi:hypothetical protein
MSMNAQADVDAAELRAALLAEDERHQAEAAAMRRDLQRFVYEEKALRERQQAEREALKVLSYRDAAVAQAVSNQTIAPQLASFVNGTTREQVDAALEQARRATEEILVEVAGARPQVEQPRDETTGRYVPAEQPVADRGLPAGISDAELRAAQNGSLDMRTYLQMRERLHVGQRDAGLFA